MKYKNTDMHLHPGENTKVPEYDKLTDTVHKFSVFFLLPLLWPNNALYIASSFDLCNGSYLYIS